jgi:probable F420-dependent oxidoreductase
MRFALGLTVHHPIPDEFCEGPFLAELGRRAEAAGFEAVYFTEHPMPGDDWLHSGGHDALDPFVALAYVAASTTTIKLFTNLTVLPYRNPFLLAKSVATLDRASGGRVLLGAGVGYQETEYEALGVPFEERNERFDESLALLRAVWSGESVAYESPRFRAGGNTAKPTPIQDPLPIWLGGNAKITLRRVAAHAQGWMPLINPRALGARRRSRHLETLEDLQQYQAELQAECDRIGRTDPIDIAYMVLAGGSPLGDSFEVDAHLDGLAQNAAVGVTWNILTIGGGGSSAQLFEAVDRYGERIIRVSGSLA